MKWFQNEPAKPELPERIREHLEQSSAPYAWNVDALPEMVPGEMYGDAVVWLEKRARWVEEMREWEKRQPYSFIAHRSEFRLFDSDPLPSAVLGSHGSAWFERYRAMADAGADETVLRRRAAEIVEALRIIRRGYDMLYERSGP